MTQVSRSSMLAMLREFWPRLPPFDLGAGRVRFGRKRANALLWWAAGDKALGKKVRRLIEDDTIGIFVSAATAWEIATKVRLGNLVWGGPDSVEAYCAGQRFELLPVSFAHAERAGSWPQPHGDPFDRMLAAQSALDRLPLATNDHAIVAFGVETVW